MAATMPNMPTTGCHNQLQGNAYMNQMNQMLNQNANPLLNRMHNYGYQAEKIISDKNIFIPKQFTERAIYKNKLLEKFESTKQLFYYLRHRSNVAAIHGDLRVFNFINYIQQSGQYKNCREMLIFCTDLHHANGAGPLYMIGRKNTKNSSRQNTIEKWKMCEFFLSADEIYHKYGINREHLPLGASSHLSSYNVKLHSERLLWIKNSVSVDEYSALKYIKTKSVNTTKDNQYIIRKDKWVAAVRRSTILKQIISFSEDKCKYYIDMVLLVNVDSTNWVGVVFRNFDAHNYTPVDLVIDCYDLRNKMILFQPPKTQEAYDEMHKYKNSICGFSIVDRKTAKKYTFSHDEHNQQMAELEQKLFEANQRILSLQYMVGDKDKIIDEQYTTIQMLRQQNNYYFEQVINPKMNNNKNKYGNHSDIHCKQQPYNNNAYERNQLSYYLGDEENSLNPNATPFVASPVKNSKTKKKKARWRNDPKRKEAMKKKKKEKKSEAKSVEQDPPDPPYIVSDNEMVGQIAEAVEQQMFEEGVTVNAVMTEENILSTSAF